MFVLDISFINDAFIIKQLVTPRIGCQRQPRPSRSSSKTKGKDKEGQTGESHEPAAYAASSTRKLRELLALIDC